MSHESAIGTISTLGRGVHGVFRGCTAVDLGVSRKQLRRLTEHGVITRELPDTYRMTVVPRSRQQALRAALLWAGENAAAAGRSAGETFDLEGVCAPMPEIIVPRASRKHNDKVVVHRCDEYTPMMCRRYHGVPVTGVEATLIALGSSLDAEAFEVACEDARRRRLTSVPSLRAYLDRFGLGRPGAVPMRELLGQLDPTYASRSTLEVKTRRLLVANGFTDFVRELPLQWKGRTYRFDFAFVAARTILETNGRRWHDDPSDYEHDNEKWSVPGRHGFGLVLATWAKVTEAPQKLLEELAATRRSCTAGSAQPVVLHSRPNQR